MKKEKKILSIFILVLSLQLILISCSEDDNDNSLIMGIWKYHSVTAGEIVTNSETNTENIEPFVTSLGEDMFEGFKYFFRPDGKLESSYNDLETVIGTYSYYNGILTMIGGDQTLTIKASVDDGVLLFEQDFTRSCNNLKQDELIDLGIDDEDFKATKATAIISFSKQ